MFDKIENKIKITLRIVPISPLLIKASDGTVEAAGNEIKWNRTDGKKEPYIPGSTFKGMFKDKFYTIWYDYLKVDEDKLNEFTFDKKEDIVDAYEKEMEKVLNTDGEDEFLEKSLRISKLFGATGLKSRIHLGDAHFENRGNFEEKIKGKSITPIDRFTGKALVPLTFDYTKESFITELTIENVLSDELKNILFVIRDSNEGEIRIGSSKTRGFGEVKLEIKEVEIIEYKKNPTINLELNELKLNEEKSFKIGDAYISKAYVLKNNPKENFEIMKKVIGE